MEWVWWFICHCCCCCAVIAAANRAVGGQVARQLQETWGAHLLAIQCSALIKYGGVDKFVEYV